MMKCRLKGVRKTYDEGQKNGDYGMFHFDD